MNNREFILKLLFLFFLIILVFSTSFRTGEKLYFLQDSVYTNSVEGNLARWNFNARIIYSDKEDLNEVY